MKRIIFLAAALALAFVGRAQTDSIDCSCDTCLRNWECQPHLNVYIGLQADATLFANGNDASPYYSRFGFNLRIPLVLRHRLSPHWQLLGGLRYDFSWMPLYYRVAQSGEGVDFPVAPEATTQHAHAFFGYLGVPLEVSWYPFANNSRTLDISADLFFGYALTRHISVSEYTNGVGGSDYTVEGASLLPWKLEVGLSIGTSYIGLIHGVRFFANLLPTYEDLATGERIYLAGMSIYL